MPPIQPSFVTCALAVVCLQVLLCGASVTHASASGSLLLPESWRPSQPVGAVGALILLSASSREIAAQQVAIARGLGAEVARQGGYAILVSDLPSSPDEAVLEVVDRLARELVAEMGNAPGAGRGRYVTILVGSQSDVLLRRRLAGTEPEIAAGVPMLPLDPACVGPDPAAASSGLTLLRHHYYGRHPETRDCQRLDRELRNRRLWTNFQYTWEAQLPRRGREQGWELDVRALLRALGR